MVLHRQRSFPHGLTQLDLKRNQFDERGVTQVRRGLR
jgi:hypothetical protein